LHQDDASRPLGHPKRHRTRAGARFAKATVNQNSHGADGDDDSKVTKSVPCRAIARFESRRRGARMTTRLPLPAGMAALDSRRLRLRGGRAGGPFILAEVAGVEAAGGSFTMMPGERGGS